MPVVAISELVVGQNRIPVGVLQRNTPVNDPQLKVQLRFFPVGGDTVTPQAEADALVPEGRGWEWNQALLDLGATVCTARNPKCDDCPVSADCAWRRTGGDDPFVATRQSTFEGSDRQGRGRLVDALRLGPVAPADVPTACGWPNDPDRAHRIAASLVTDGLVVTTNGVLTLPGP